MCKRALEVPDELMGKRVKCPGCKMIFTASPPGAAPPEAPAGRRPAPSQKSEEGIRRKRPVPPPDDEDEDEEEEEEVRPRVRKKSVRRREEDYEDEEEDEDEEEEEEDDDDEEEEAEERRPRRRRRPRPRFSSRAASAVGGPAIALMILGIIGLVCDGSALGMNLLGSAIGDKVEDKNLQLALSLFQGTFGLIHSAAGVLIGLSMLLSGIQMRKLKGYKNAMTSSILAMIPIVSPCCLVGLPIGIWSVVVLCKPEVKDAFR
jgi:hypothetical protein